MDSAVREFAARVTSGGGGAGQLGRGGLLLLPLLLLWQLRMHPAVLMDGCALVLGRGCCLGERVAGWKRARTHLTGSPP